MAKKLTHAQARALRFLEESATKNHPWHDSFDVSESITTLGALAKRALVETEIRRTHYGWYTTYYRITAEGCIARDAWRG